MDYIDEIKAFLVEGPSQLSSERMSICRTCEHFQRRFSICSKCGCVLPVKNKTAYDEMSYWEMVMGMFDTIHCNYDLGAGFWNRDLQTKDLECCCCEYWLDPAGKLWQIDYSGTQDFEDESFRNTVSNGNRGKIRPYYITTEVEVYPASWDSHYAPFPRQTITFIDGQLCMKN